MISLSSDLLPTPPVFLPLGIRLNTTALIGENVSLYCAADGWPLPSVHWIKGNGKDGRIFAEVN